MTPIPLYQQNIPSPNIFIFSNRRTTRLHSKKLQIAGYRDLAVPNLNIRIIFLGVYHSECDTYLGRILPWERDAREESIKTHVYITGKRTPFRIFK